MLRAARAPDPALSTLDAKPEAVTCASAGGAATSAGAGMGAPAAMARTESEPTPVATTPPSSTRRASEVAPLAAARRGTHRGTLLRQRDCAREGADATARRSTRDAALPHGTRRPRAMMTLDIGDARRATGGAARLLVCTRLLSESARNVSAAARTATVKRQLAQPGLQLALGVVVQRFKRRLIITHLERRKLQNLRVAG